MTHGSRYRQGKALPALQAAKERGCPSPALCLRADLRRNAPGICDCISYTDAVSHTSRFFVPGYHNDLRSTDLWENSALRLTVSRELFPGFCRIFLGTLQREAGCRKGWRKPCSCKSETSCNQKVPKQTEIPAHRWAVPGFDV